MAQYGNALVKKAKTTSEQPCTFTANGVEVKLTPATVKNYLVSGNAERITDQEVVMFINLCKCVPCFVFIMNISCDVRNNLSAFSCSLLDRGLPNELLSMCISFNE